MRKAVEHLLAADPVLAGVIERIGPCRMTYRPPAFETLLRSILYQQVSGAAALTVLKRLQAMLGELTPERVMAYPPEQLRAAGLSGQKTSYLRNLAEKTLSGEVRFQDLPAMPDDAVIAHLIQVKGIGIWTAQMFLMFALKRPDVLPTGDLGIRSAMKREYRMRTLPKPERMIRVARPWRPYASIASWYLWRSLDGDAAL